MNPTPSLPSAPFVSPTTSSAEPLVTQFLRNRALYRVDQLQPYDGQWVAFSKDGTKIIAAAPDLLELGRKLEEIGQDPQQVVFEQLWATDDLCLGGAEFL